MNEYIQKVTDNLNLQKIALYDVGVEISELDNNVTINCNVFLFSVLSLIHI